MTPAARRDDDGQAGPTARTMRLVLVLDLDADGETVRGTIGPADGSRPTGFHGWIGLMSAITDLCSQTGHGSGAVKPQ
jgi:hypothetical protein